MLDVVYVLATIAFFALMVAYVVSCERLGAVPPGEREIL
jgi:hypothetical protein